MNCDPLARWYRWLEYAAFGRSLERRREQFLSELKGVRRALVLGDGDGRFLAAFVRESPPFEVDTVDNSARMIALARRRVPANPDSVQTHVHFHHADVRRWQPPPAVLYDMIVTHFFLDCFTTDELLPILARIATAATPNARWIVSEFRQPERGLAAWRARLWIGGLYRLFGLTTGLRVRRLPDYASVLERHGFHREQTVLSEWGLLVSESWRRR